MNNIQWHAVNISEIDFIQESLKWICRWSSKYCAEQSENKVKISAEEIYELMGMAYSYEQFYRMWQLHNKQIVKFRQFGNKLEFTYCNEETYMVHSIHIILQSAFLQCQFGVSNFTPFCF